MDQALDWRRADITLPLSAWAEVTDAASRERWDRAVLGWLRHQDEDTSLTLHELSLGLSGGQANLAWRAFWKISAAFFEVLAHLPVVEAPVVKRLALQILLQCAAQFRGEPAPSQSLAVDLLRHCRLLAPSDLDLPWWQRLRQGFEPASTADQQDWLGAADQSSQQLEAQLSAWAEAEDPALPRNAIPLAWSLAVDAEDAGLDAMAEFATLLAQCLQSVLYAATPEQAQLLAAAASHLRQLLHQHAAGMDKPAQAALLQSLRDWARTTE